ncbi:hypothetical protein N2152v2_002841 [Parachlorella kessleri]
MLISLEEEAAEEASQASYLSAEGLEQDSLGRLRSTSAASTWNLERLEALAAEVAALFYTRCQELGVAGDLQAASNAGAPDSGLLDLHLALVRAYPTQLLGAVNDVVFGQQGYAKMQRHGDPRDSLLSSVLERGRGSPAALAIMYREVCARLGLPMHAAVLEGGGYLVLWPADAAVHLTAAGERLVVDPFAGGALYSMEEVALLFDIRIGPQGIRPATSRELLGALLKSLQDSHWCRSMGCPPEPALMTPISLDLALGSPDDHATGGGEVEPSVNACQAFSSEEASESTKPRQAVMKHAATQGMICLVTTPEQEAMQMQQGTLRLRLESRRTLQTLRLLQPAAAQKAGFKGHPGIGGYD